MLPWTLGLLLRVWWAPLMLALDMATVPFRAPMWLGRGLYSLSCKAADLTFWVCRLHLQALAAPYYALTLAWKCACWLMSLPAWLAMGFMKALWIVISAPWRALARLVTLLLNALCSFAQVQLWAINSFTGMLDAMMLPQSRKRARSPLRHDQEPQRWAGVFGTVSCYLALVPALLRLGWAMCSLAARIILCTGSSLLSTILPSNRTASKYLLQVTRSFVKSFMPTRRRSVLWRSTSFFTLWGAPRWVTMFRPFHPSKDASLDAVTEHTWACDKTGRSRRASLSSNFTDDSSGQPPALSPSSSMGRSTLSKLASAVTKLLPHMATSSSSASGSPIAISSFPPSPSPSLSSSSLMDMEEPPRQRPSRLSSYEFMAEDLIPKRWWPEDWMTDADHAYLKAQEGGNTFPLCLIPARWWKGSIMATIKAMIKDTPIMDLVDHVQDCHDAIASYLRMFTIKALAAQVRDWSKEASACVEEATCAARASALALYGKAAHALSTVMLGPPTKPKDDGLSSPVPHATLTAPAPTPCPSPPPAPSPPPSTPPPATVSSQAAGCQATGCDAMAVQQAVFHRSDGQLKELSSVFSRSNLKMPIAAPSAKGVGTLPKRPLKKAH